MSSRILSWVLFACALGVIMHPWLSTSAPLTVNSENIPEINYIWRLRNLIEQGDAFTAWQPKALAGEAADRHLLYPLYWLTAQLSTLTNIPSEILYKALVYIDLLLGAIFMYEFVLRLTHRPATGLVAGLIFSLIPGHMNTIEGFFIKVSWLAVPLIFWLYEREFGQVREPSFKGAVRLGLAVGLMALASIQIPLMMILILPPYLVLREWQIQRANQIEAGSTYVKPAPHDSKIQKNADAATTSYNLLHTWLKSRGVPWLVTGGIVLGVSAYYYVPVLIELEHLAFSRFAGYPSGGTITLDFLIYMVTARWYSTFSPENFHEVTWYLGDVALVLALVGIISRYKTGIVIFFTGAGIVSLLLLVGHSLGPLPNIVYSAVEQIPLIKGVLRHSFRWVLPLSFSLAVLAGFGTATLVTRLKLTAGLWSHGAMLLLTGLLLFDYYPLSASFRTTSSYLRDSEMEAIAWLNRQETDYRYFAPFADGTWRTYHFAYSHHLIRRPAVWDDQYVSHYVSKRAYTFLAGLNVQLPDLPSGLLDPLFLQMLDLGSVRHILIFLESYNHQDLFNTATALGAPVVFEQDEVRILENRSARPLMQLYPKTALYLGNTADDEQLRAWLPHLTPKEIALLDGAGQQELTYLKTLADYLLLDSEAELGSLSSPEQPRALWPEQAAGFPKQILPEHQISWTRPRPTHAEVNVQLSQPATLVFAEAWYPGWHVTVDGVEQPLLRANYAFQGVALQAGEHMVIFEHRRPLYARIAGGITLVTLLLALGILIRK